MKSNLKLFLIVINITILMIGLLSYYKQSPEIYFTTERDEYKLSEKEASQKMKVYDDNYSYYHKSIIQYKHTKTLIPFYYKKELEKKVDKGYFQSRN